MVEVKNSCTTKKIILFKYVVFSHFCRAVWLFCEDSEYDVSLLVLLEGGGDDQVVAGREAEPARHLPQVDERLGAGAAGVVAEEVGVAAARLRVLQGVHAEPDGEQLESLVTQGAPAPLHQVHYDGALILVVPLVWILQADHVLRVAGERLDEVPAAARAAARLPAATEGGDLPAEPAVRV